MTKALRAIYKPCYYAARKKADEEEIRAEAIACRERYGDAEAFLTTFNPDNCRTYCDTNLERCYVGQSPRMDAIETAYGQEVAKAWVVNQLRVLNEESKCSIMLSAEELEDTAVDILAECKVFHISEVGHFFLLCKRGHYHEYYGAVSKLKIMCSLQEYKRERKILKSHFILLQENRANQSNMEQQGQTMNICQWQEYKKQKEIYKSAEADKPANKESLI